MPARATIDFTYHDTSLWLHVSNMSRAIGAASQQARDPGAGGI